MERKCQFYEWVSSWGKVWLCREMVRLGMGRVCVWGCGSAYLVTAYVPPGVWLWRVCCKVIHALSVQSAFLLGSVLTATRTRSLIYRVTLLWFTPVFIMHIAWWCCSRQRWWRWGSRSSRSSHRPVCHFSHQPCSAFKGEGIWHVKEFDLHFHHLQLPNLKPYMTHTHIYHMHALYFR